MAKRHRAENFWYLNIIIDKQGNDDNVANEIVESSDQPWLMAPGLVSQDNMVMR